MLVYWLGIATGVWTILISPNIDMDRANQQLEEILNPIGVKFTLGIHLSSKVEKCGKGGGPAGNHIVRGKDNRVTLPIGTKVIRKVTKVKDGETVKEDIWTKIGAFFTVKNAGVNKVLAFTNCEGAKQYDSCYVEDGASGEWLTLGKVYTQMEGVINVRRRVDDNGKSHEVAMPVFFDGMLIEIDLFTFHPTNEVISMKSSKNKLVPYTRLLTLKPYTESIQDIQQEHIKLLKPQMHVGKPNGYILSVSMNNKTKEPVFKNALAITEKLGEMMSISVKGDCGTLVTSALGADDDFIYLYASIFGAFYITYVDIAFGGLEKTDGYSVAFPLHEFIRAALSQDTDYWVMKETDSLIPKHNGQPESGYASHAV